MKRFFQDLQKARVSLQEPTHAERVVEVGALARLAGGRFRDIRSCMYSLDLEELGQIAGEAQDADGNFIRRDDAIGPNLKEAKNSAKFKQAQRNIIRQMEIEASL